MIRSQITIVNKLGLHARAAAKFVSLSTSFASRIEAGNEDKLVDGKSIMAIMMLAAGQGTVLNLHVEGADEQQAFEALESLINNRFDEDE